MTTGIEEKRVGTERPAAFFVGNTFFVVSAAVLFGLFAFQLWYHAIRTSATIDEPVHILAGHKHLQCKDFGINPEHPPLSKLISAVPLQFMDLQEPPWECGSRITSKLDSFAYGNEFVVNNGVDRVVIPSRIAVSILSLLMAVVVFLTAWQMFGRIEALVALAIVSFEPNFVAHGAVVTTDMALTLTALGLVFALYRYGQTSSLKNFLIAGIAFGLLLAGKHSAVILLPILYMVFLVDGLWFARSKRSLPKRLGRRTVEFAALFLIGLIVLWTFYGFQALSIPSATEQTVSITDYIKENGRPEMVTSMSAKIVDGIGRTGVFPESYVYGLADIVATGSRNSIIFDRVYPTGRWFYFPIAFVVKSSIPLLLLLPIGFASVLFLREKRREFLFLLVPPLWFFGIAMTSGINIGLRHVLPVYPFLIVIAAAGAAALYRRSSLFGFGLAVIVLFHAWTAYRVFSNNIAFSNDLWGGPTKTHLVFSDGNSDWGQNLKIINDYAKERNITDCWFVGMGNTQLKRAMQPCRTMPDTFRYWMNNTIDDAVPPVIEGTVLVSARDLPPRAASEYVPITEGRLVDQIGSSIFVYEGRFEVPLAAALSHARRSAQFLRQKRVDEAEAEARRAVELSPEDPRTHLALGVVHDRMGRKAEARLAFETVIEKVRSSPKPAIFRNEEVRAMTELDKLGNQ